MAAKSLRFKNKVAVLAGATDGIGYAIADRLARDGAKIMISSRKQSNVDRAVDSLQKQYGNESVSGVVCHVGKDEDRKNLIQETVKLFGGIDVLVNNAGVNPKSSIGKTLEVTHQEWIKLFDVNVISASLLVKEAHPYLKKRRGSVLFVSSSGAYYLDSAYSVSKLALNGLMRALARELAVDNIRVNCIAPALIKTEFSKYLWENEDILKDIIATHYWINKLGLPEDCAGAAAFLCSDEAGFITGESLQIAGASSRI